MGKKTRPSPKEMRTMLRIPENLDKIPFSVKNGTKKPAGRGRGMSVENNFVRLSNGTTRKVSQGKGPSPLVEPKPEKLSMSNLRHKA